MPDVDPNGPGTVTAENPSGPVATPEPGTSGPGGEPEDKTGTTETFYTGDVNALPPQLKDSYNNMLRDYHRKTEDLANRRKSMDEHERKAVLYDELSRDPAFVSYWNKLAQSGNQPQETPTAQGDIPLPITPEEWQQIHEGPEGFVKVMDKYLQERNKPVQEKLRAFETDAIKRTAAEAIDEFADEKTPDGKLRYPLFKTFRENYPEVLVGILNQEPEAKNPSEYGRRLKNAYEKTVKFYNAIYEEGKKVGQGILQRKAEGSSEMPTIPVKEPAYQGKDPRKLTVREARELAEQRVRVPLSYTT